MKNMIKISKVKVRKLKLTLYMSLCQRPENIYMCTGTLVGIEDEVRAWPRPNQISELNNNELINIFDTTIEASCYHERNKTGTIKFN